MSNQRLLASHLARLAGVPLTEILAAVSDGRLDAQRAGSLVMVGRSSAARYLASLSSRDEPQPREANTTS